LTFFYKRVLPILWIGVLLFPLLLVANRGTWTRVAEISALVQLIGSVAVGGVFYIIWKKCLSDFVDEVFDDGDTLVVRNRGQEDRITLAPQPVTLVLREPSLLGSKVTFTPRGLIPFSVTSELAQRIKAGQRAS
jgi:hypothetical protein